MVAAAILGAGALSAGASIWGAGKAASAQKDIAAQEMAYSNAIYGQNVARAQPFIDTGTNALSALTNWTNPTAGSGSPLSTLTKLTTPGADLSSTLSQLPGYQFEQTMGTRAIQNALAARGLGGSQGPLIKNIGDYVTGLAGTTWGNLVSGLQNTFTSGANALQGLVNTGTNALGTVTGAGTGVTSAVNQALTGAGNAAAAGYNAIGAGVGNLSNSVPTALLLQKLLGGGGGGSSIYGTAGAVS